LARSTPKCTPGFFLSSAPAAASASSLRTLHRICATTESDAATSLARIPEGSSNPPPALLERLRCPWAWDEEEEEAEE
jgi:hypothetical protein